MTRFSPQKPGECVPAASTESVNAGAVYRPLSSSLIGLSSMVYASIVDVLHTVMPASTGLISLILFTLLSPVKVPQIMEVAPSITDCSLVAASGSGLGL